MRRVPAPNARELVLPILACLPTAFLSPKPPPALLPLLSPVLRQRIHIHTSTVASNEDKPSNLNSTWLQLLTWSPEKASSLNEIVSTMQLEPHPVSGELLLFDDATDPNAGKVVYRRLDSETVQAKCDVWLHGVGVVWVWCTGDTGGVGLEPPGDGQATDGWKVAEVVPLEDDIQDSQGWYASMPEAEEAFDKFGTPNHAGTSSQQTKGSKGGAKGGDEEDDDDYWASYDRTPGKTPTPGAGESLSMSRSGAPPMPGRQRSVSEMDYFARYGNEVQPALDSHDPDEEVEEDGPDGVQPTLRPSEEYRPPTPPPESSKAAQPVARQPTAREILDNHFPWLENEEGFGHILRRKAILYSPSPTRPSSSDSGRASVHASRPVPGVERLEAEAHISAQAEISVKHHISTEIKSLFRLARGMGIEREEFQRVIMTELEVLEMVAE